MGLDMYLSSNRKVDDNEDYEIGYWRKANHIRKWFDDYGISKGYDLDFEKFDEQWQYLPLDLGAIETLEETIKAVIENIKKAPELLPTAEGFFFGSQKYDERYFDKLENTLEILEEAKEEIEEGFEVYYSEWY